MMLSVFSNMLSKESDLRVIDNLCAALCRMMMSNVEAVPLEQVYLQFAPLLPRLATSSNLYCGQHIFTSRKFTAKYFTKKT